jgi:hypothetical protein
MTERSSRNPRRPSSKARRKNKRAALVIPAGPRPVLVASTASGIESWAREQAVGRGLACVGYFCAATTLGGPGLVATPTPHPAQALKWNTRAADATLLLAPNGPAFGRARAAIAWCARYRKRWLLLTPASFDAAQLRVWLRTRPPGTLQISGPLAHQAAGLAPLLAQVLDVIDESALSRAGADQVRTAAPQSAG